jgi:hypothetical protein
MTCGLFSMCESDRVRCSYSGFEVHQDGAWDVARIVGLVEKDIFAVAAFGSKVFEVAVAIDAVFLAQLLPELRAHCTKCVSRVEAPNQAEREVTIPLLPHWPAWSVMISLHVYRR